MDTLNAQIDTSAEQTGCTPLRASLAAALATVGALLAADPAMAGNERDLGAAQTLRDTAARITDARNAKLDAESRQIREDFRAKFDLPSSVSDGMLVKMMGMGISQRAGCAFLLKRGHPEDNPGCK